MRRSGSRLPPCIICNGCVAAVIPLDIIPSPIQRLSKHYDLNSIIPKNVCASLILVAILTRKHYRISAPKTLSYRHAVGRWVSRSSWGGGGNSDGL